MRKRRAADRDRVCPTENLYEEKHPMNIITNLLAGVVHFLGWLI
ncbi:hypothetical protein [Streptomyces laurentii]